MAGLNLVDGVGDLSSQHTLIAAVCARGRIHEMFRRTQNRKPEKYAGTYEVSQGSRQIQISHDVMSTASFISVDVFDEKKASPLMLLCRRWKGRKPSDADHFLARVNDTWPTTSARNRRPSRFSTSRLDRDTRCRDTIASTKRMSAIRAHLSAPPAVCHVGSAHVDR